MYKVSDFKVGDTVYLELTGNAVRYKRRNTEECIKEAVVTSVGRKYVTVGDDTKFEISNNDYYRGLVQHTQYCVDYVLYKSKQEILDKFESEKLLSEVRSFFQYGKTRCLQLDDLRSINDLINQRKEEYKNEKSN